MTILLVVLGIILLICLANSGSAKPKMTKAQVRKELMWRMQHWHGQKELDDLFNFYNEHTEYDLKNYPPFKSWYKTHIDDWLKDGCVRLKGGSEYDPAEDPLYDPDAPDWYDTYAIQYYDDNDDDDDEGDDDVLEKLYEQQKIDKMSLTERIDYEARRKRKSF